MMNDSLCTGKTTEIPPKLGSAGPRRGAPTATCRRQGIAMTFLSPSCAGRRLPCPSRLGLLGESRLRPGCVSLNGFATSLARTGHSVPLSSRLCWLVHPGAGRPDLPSRWLPGMLIGVDATCWSNGRGYGRHARALLRALVDLDAHNQYTFFFDADPAGVAPGLPASVRLHWVRSSVPAVLAAAAQGRRSLRDMWRMSWAISRADLDVVLFPTIYSYVPVWGRARKVVMIHDVIAEKFPHLTVPSRRARLAWRAKVALGIRQADAIATVSAYSRGHILEHFGLAPERVSVVGEASDAIFRTLDHPSLTPRLLDAGIHPEGRSILYVGGFGPHKNLPTLLAAFAELASQPGFSDVQLILVGEHTSEVFYT